MSALHLLCSYCLFFISFYYFTIALENTTETITNKNFSCLENVHNRYLTNNNYNDRTH